MRQANILLVEDNPGDVVLMKSALKSSSVSHNLLVAEDAVQALDVLYRRNGHESDPRIDLAFFDINLPGMSGIELLRTVKTDPSIQTTPVIMLTSSEAPEDIKRSYIEHANGYVNKPTALSELKDLVSTIESFWFSHARLPSHL